MADVFVKPGNTVEHDGTQYSPEAKAGPKITGLTDEQAKTLLEAGVVQTQDVANGVVPQLVPEGGTPTEAEIAAAAEAAGNKTGGLFHRG